MEKIEEQLNNINSSEIPFGIHQSIMKKVNYRKIRPVLFFVFFLFLINFIFLISHINGKLVDAEFSDMMSDFMEDFSMTSGYIGVILQSFFDIVSPLLIFSAFVSFVGIIYFGRKITIYQFMKI